MNLNDKESNNICMKQVIEERNVRILDLQVRLMQCIELPHRERGRDKG